MSQLETNPLVNPTTEIDKQNQKLEINQPQVLSPALPDDYIRQSVKFETQQLSITGAAGMYKLDRNVTWSLGQTPNTVIYSLELTLANLLRFAPLGVPNQTFVNFDSVILEIPNSFNPFYQGSLLAFYDPSPSPGFYALVMGLTLTRQVAWQFKNKDLIMPKNRAPFLMKVPVRLPFNFFQIRNPESTVSDYINNYSFGRIELMVNSKLMTTSTKVSQSLRVNVGFENFTTCGNVFT